MTAISAASPFAPANAAIALPGKFPIQSPPPASAGAGLPASAGAGPPGAPMARPGGRDGPLRNGNPRGDPNLAPRCGAKARSGLACRAPAMANGRCKNHGGKCTGPRTPEGLARLATARTKHGDHGAAWRAIHRYQRTLIVRSLLFAAAYLLRAYLPPEIAARVAAAGTDIPSPSHYSNGPVAPDAGESPLDRGKAGRDARGRFVARARPALRGQRLEREAARREAALLAPWRAGIAQARAAKRAAFHARRAEQRAARGQDATQGATARSDGADAREGPVVGLRQGVTPGQGARSAEREQDLMKPETVRSERVDAAVGSVPGLRQGGTLGQRARSAERQQDLMKRETVRLAQVDAGVGSVPSLGPGGTLGQGARSAECEQELMKRGTVRLAQVDAGVGSLPSLGPNGTLGQGARSAECDQELMNRETVRLDGAAAGVGSVPGLRPDGTLGQGAGSAEREQELMNRETVRLDGAAAGVGSVPGLRPDGTLGQGAGSAEREHNEMPSLPPGAGPGGETVRAGGADGGVGSVPGLQQGGSLGQGARSAKRERDAMPGRPPGPCPGAGAGGLEDAAVPRRMAGTSPAMMGCPALTGCKGGGRDPKAAPATELRPGDGAVRSCGWKLRRVAELRRRRRAGVALADSADRAGRRLTAQMAIHAAAPAGQDWRPGMAEAVRRMAEVAERLRARCIPRAGGVADVVRRDGVAGGG